MNFQKLKTVENAEFYLDVAFRKARKRGMDAKSKSKVKGIEMTRQIEIQKINTVRSYLDDTLTTILKSFPDFDNMDPFYQELCETEFDPIDYKRALGSINGVVKKINDFFRHFNPILMKAAVFNKLIEQTNSFYGRVSSLFKKVNPELKFLEDIRKLMRDFPSIKTKMFTVAIAGFPNVGKSTVLNKLTASDPEINSYPFTTKGIMLGYIGMHNQKRSIQFMDTPGTLDRFKKMNDIEKKAYLAIKHCAHMILYVFDLSEEFPLNKQIQLYKRFLEEHSDKKMLVYLSKTDILDKEIIEQFQKKYPEAMTDLEEIKEIIIKSYKKHSIMIHKENMDARRAEEENSEEDRN